MAEIVYAAGVPHAPAIVGLFDKATPDQQKVVRDIFSTVRRELDEAKPDVLLVFTNDHLTNSRILQYPDFMIGMASTHSGPHEWFKPWIGCRDYTIKGDPAMATAPTFDPNN
ncbi:MAG: hypothetical protein ACM3N5_16335, partial [Candidatus Eiseniibacteriota bacterium]